MSAQEVKIILPLEAAIALRALADEHRSDLPPGLALEIRVALNTAVVLGAKD